MPNTPSLDRPVTEYLSYPGYTLRENLTIEEALARLRGYAGDPEQKKSDVIYFYVTDEQDKLVGILPVRRLILSPGNALISELMTRNLITLTAKDTLYDALELFAMHRLLAIPVVDKAGGILGIVEISLYTDEVVDLAEHRQLSEVFQLIGLRLEQHKQGSAWAGFRLRMPWLLANITGGLICAALGSFFEATVQKVVLVALFIPLILTLAESISVQSMTLAIEQSLSKRSMPRQLRLEVLTSLMIGTCSGVIVGLVSLFWRGPLAATLTIGGSVAVAMFLAALLGRAVPRVIHLMKLNPRIAAGPITLAIVDVVTVTLYLSAAAIILGS